MQRSASIREKFLISFYFFSLFRPKLRISLRIRGYTFRESAASFRSREEDVLSSRGTYSTDGVPRKIRSLERESPYVDRRAKWSGE